MVPGLADISARCSAQTVTQRNADVLHHRIVAIAVDHARGAAGIVHRTGGRISGGVAGIDNGEVGHAGNAILQCFPSYCPDRWALRHGVSHSQRHCLKTDLAGQARPRSCGPSARRRAHARRGHARHRLVVTIAMTVADQTDDSRRNPGASTAAVRAAARAPRRIDDDDSSSGLSEQRRADRIPTASRAAWRRCRCPRELDVRTCLRILNHRASSALSRYAASPLGLL